MLGRIILLQVKKWIGERRALYIYALISFGYVRLPRYPRFPSQTLNHPPPSLEFAIWFVPSLIGNAITVSFIGMLLGPMYPIALNQAARVLPPWILTGAVGWIAGFGQAGSALIPFMTGAIAQNHMIKSLHPLYVGFLVWDANIGFLRLIAMMALMVGLFALVPNRPLVETAKEQDPPMEALQEKNALRGEEVCCQ
jgi:fucose permease